MAKLRTASLAMTLIEPSSVPGQAKDARLVHACYAWPPDDPHGFQHMFKSALDHDRGLTGTIVAGSCMKREEQRNSYPRLFLGSGLLVYIGLAAPLLFLLGTNQFLRSHTLPDDFISLAESIDSIIRRLRCPLSFTHGSAVMRARLGLL